MLSVCILFFAICSLVTVTGVDMDLNWARLMFAQNERTKPILDMVDEFLCLGAPFSRFKDGIKLRIAEDRDGRVLSLQIETLRDESSLIDGDIEDLSALPRDLKMFALTGNKGITTLAIAHGLRELPPGLKELYLSGIELPEELDGLPRTLKWLFLSHNPLGRGNDGVLNLSNLPPTLRQIDVRDTSLKQINMFNVPPAFVEIVATDNGPIQFDIIGRKHKLARRRIDPIYPQNPVGYHTEVKTTDDNQQKKTFYVEPVVANVWWRW